MKRIFILGLDSATFDIILPMVREGKLPNLSPLITEGSSGPLQSTMPPVTPPAWVSFMTGKNPGKHGVFDFYASPSYGYVRPILNARYIKAKTLWKILSEHGVRVGVINLPITHPPELVNGFIIPGMQYSFEGTDFSYPPGLLQEIREKLGEYKVVFGDLESLYTNKLDRFLQEWRDIVEIRKRAILYLMEREPWDVFMAVFYSIDAIQHHFWKFFDSTHPLHDPALAQKYGTVIPEFYERVDTAIGEILSRLDENTTIIVLSDHGAGPEKGAFYINRWLAREGFLSLKQGFSFLWRIRFPHLFYKILRRLRFPGIAWTVPLDQLKTLGRIIDPREGLNIPFFINWERTKAYAGNHTEQGIYINLKGREPSGIVEKEKEYEALRESIIKKLRETKIGNCGESFTIKAYKKEEVYYGPYSDDAPDIFVEIQGGECLLQKEIHHRELFGLADKTSGTHRMEGMLILKGNEIKAHHTVQGARIIDLAPTILHLLGLPVPEDMDGKVLTEVFTKEYRVHHPVTYGPASLITGGEEGIFSEEESEQIRKRLRDLGYL